MFLLCKIVRFHMYPLEFKLLSYICVRQSTALIILYLEQLYGNLMALPSAVVEEGVSTVFSYISTKVEDKASRADTIARLEIALSLPETV